MPDILITGGTGSFGRQLVRTLLGTANNVPPFDRIIIYSRDEWKQSEMARELAPLDPHGRLRFFLGDVRDGQRLRRALRGVDYVVHAAALKQVPATEYNPTEAVRTNIGGAVNLIEAALDTMPMGATVIALSTDKAVSPVNLYGATKLAAEKLFTAANALAGATGPRFACVRYGNVIGSRGSVVQLFREQHAAGKLPTITDPRMTRFWITLQNAVDFTLMALGRATGGEIFVPRLPSMNILDLADVIFGARTAIELGIRPGEKLHETLIGEDEARHTRRHEWYYEILPEGAEHPAVPPEERPPGAYRSDTNPDTLSVTEMRGMLGELP